MQPCSMAAAGTGGHMAHGHAPAHQAHAGSRAPRSASAAKRQGADSAHAGRGYLPDAASASAGTQESPCMAGVPKDFRSAQSAGVSASELAIAAVLGLGRPAIRSWLKSSYKLPMQLPPAGDLNLLSPPHRCRHSQGQRGRPGGACSCIRMQAGRSAATAKGSACAAS